MQILTIHSQAKKLLTEYKTVDDVKDFRDKALAVEIYAKQANDMGLEWDAARARVRSERRCGELLAQLEKGKTGPKGISSDGSEITQSEYATVRDRAGLNNDQASDFQKLAAVPEEEFEKAVDNPAVKPSTNHIIKPKAPEPPRMDKDALWLWGLLRDMRSKGTFNKRISALESEWTDGMRKDAAGLINNLKKWVNDYE